MRVCVVISSFYPAVLFGGPIFSTLNIYSSLVEKNEDIEVYVSTTNSNMIGSLDVETNKFIKLKDKIFVKYYKETVLNKFSLNLFLNIWSDIKKSDVVHIQGIFNTPIPISLLFAKLFKKEVIISPRGSLCDYSLTQRSFLKKLWLKVLIKPFIKNVTWHVTSHQEKKEILTHFKDVKTEIIPNGINLDEFKNYNKFTRKEYLKKFTNRIENKVDKIIVSMGRLNKKKRFDFLIDSYVELSKKNEGIYLLIAGPDDGAEKELRDKISSLKLERKVFLTGNLDFSDKVDFLANADLFILASHNENFGNVYLESLALGTPIIASKSTPWKVIETYKCGKWVDSELRDIITASEELLDQNIDQLKENSKKLARQFDVGKLSESFYKLYGKCEDKNILFLSNIPTPYQLDFLKSINSIEKTNIFGYFLFATNKNRAWKLDLPSYVTIANFKRKFSDYLKLYRFIVNNKIEKIVITGYSLDMAVFTTILAKIKSIDVSFWLERPMHKQVGIKKYLKNMYIKYMLSKSKKVFAIGELAERIYSKFNENVVNLPYSMNLDLYYNISRQVTEETKIRFLFIGQYIDRKNIINTINAFKNISDEKIELNIIGSGELELEIESLISNDRRIKNIGYVQPKDIYKVYEENDIFIMPSKHDGWALVINEAMAAGMPIISTRKVGAVIEYIKHKKNGYICTENISSIEEAIRYYLNNQEFVHSHGYKNREIIKTSFADVKNASIKLINELFNKKERYNIGLLTGSYTMVGGGGVTTVMNSLINCLSKNYNILAFAESFDKKNIHDVEYKVLDHYYLISSNLIKKLLSKDLDVLHIHIMWRYTSFATLIWHKITKKPYIVSPHGMLDAWAIKNNYLIKRIVFNLVEKPFLEKASYLHALCESEAKSIKNLGIETPIVTIPNAIELPSAENLAIPSFYKNISDKKKLLFLGRLDKKKGILELIEAMSKIKDIAIKNNWILVLAGFGEKDFEKSLLARIDELEIEEVVYFIGSVFGEEKNACYYHSDAFILPSFSEGLPMSILEAWSYKLPVLMTKECNLDNGFKMNAAIEINNEVEVLAKQLIEFFDMDEDIYQEIGINGFSLIKEEYNYSNIIDKYKKMYKSL